MSFEVYFQRRLPIIIALGIVLIIILGYYKIKEIRMKKDEKRKD